MSHVDDFKQKHPHMDCPGVVGVEYWHNSSYRYDGVSEWRCEHGRFGRWCGIELFGNEVEPPWCEGGVHPQEVA